MKIRKCIKESFAVIGKEGSTSEGNGFVKKLWEDANSHFAEVKALAKKDENGSFAGFWGAMSDLTHSFRPWEENFSKGLYLAGVECSDDAIAPPGWTKWVIPGYEYIYAENNTDNVFKEVLEYMKEENISLVGAVHDYTCPATGKNYMFFPVKAIE